MTCRRLVIVAATIALAWAPRPAWANGCPTKVELEFTRDGRAMDLAAEEMSFSYDSTSPATKKSIEGNRATAELADGCSAVRVIRSCSGMDHVLTVRFADGCKEAVHARLDFKSQSVAETAPAPGARVWFRMEEAPCDGCPEALCALCVRATASADGKYAVRDFLPGHYSIVPDRSNGTCGWFEIGGREFTMSTPGSLDIQAGKAPHAEFPKMTELDVRITGLLVGHGAPLAGATFGVRAQLADETILCFEGTTSKEGTFEYRLPRERSINLAVRFTHPSLGQLLRQQQFDSTGQVPSPMRYEAAETAGMVHVQKGGRFFGAMPDGTKVVWKAILIPAVDLYFDGKAGEMPLLAEKENELSANGETTFIGVPAGKYHVMLRGFPDPMNAEAFEALMAHGANEDIEIAQGETKDIMLEGK